MASNVQASVQPSWDCRFPSSQSSLPARTPSPHVVAHWDGDATQVHPRSGTHVLLQPSPAAAFPSSHCSTPSNNPLPQGEPASGMSSAEEAPITELDAAGDDEDC